MILYFEYLILIHNHISVYICIHTHTYALYVHYILYHIRAFKCISHSFVYTHNLKQFCSRKRCVMGCRLPWAAPARLWRITAPSSATQLIVLMLSDWWCGQQEHLLHAATSSPHPTHFVNTAWRSRWPYPSAEIHWDLCLNECDELWWIGFKSFSDVEENARVVELSLICTVLNLNGKKSLWTQHKSFF